MNNGTQSALNQTEAKLLKEARNGRICVTWEVNRRAGGSSGKRDYAAFQSLVAKGLVVMEGRVTDQEMTRNRARRTMVFATIWGHVTGV